MSKWIEVNLPWSSNTMVRPDVDTEPAKNRVNKLLGMSIKEARSKVGEKVFDEYISFMTEEDDKEKAYKKKKFIPVKKYYEFADKWDALYFSQPEVIEFMKQDEQLQLDNRQISFVGRELNKAGTLIEVVNNDGEVKTLLIGNINAIGGVCDDCKGIDYGDVVLRYKVVYES